MSVLLKTSDDEDPKALAKFVHQARVRRAVVVKLIEDAKRRGHRAYARVDIATMREKATSLPEDGVPPEIVRLLPHDTHLDKIVVQKAACPVGGRSDLDGAAEIMAKAQPNAVVLEKSSHDEADINAQRIANLRSISGGVSVLKTTSFVAASIFVILILPIIKRVVR